MIQYFHTFIISLSDAVPSRYIISASSIIWAADIPYVFEKFAKVQLFALLYRGDTSFRPLQVQLLIHGRTLELGFDFMRTESYGVKKVTSYDLFNHYTSH